MEIQLSFDFDVIEEQINDLERRIATYQRMDKCRSFSSTINLFLSDLITFYSYLFKLIFIDNIFSIAE